MRLNPRLEKALEILLGHKTAGEQETLGPSFSRLFDVGCDHAKLVIAALKREVARQALAMDIRQGPLEIARRNVSRAGLSERVEFRLADGLTGVSPGSDDAVTILGMGGLEIGDILEAASWSGKPLILVQPMRSIPELRLRLASLGLAIEAEFLGKQRGKLYLFMLLRVTGKPYELDMEDALIGSYWYENWQTCDAWPAYQPELLRVIGLKQQAVNYDPALDAARMRLETMK